MVAAALSARLAVPCTQARTQQRPARKQAGGGGGNRPGPCSCAPSSCLQGAGAPPACKTVSTTPPYVHRQRVPAARRAPALPAAARLAAAAGFAVTRCARTSLATCPCAPQLAVRAVAAEAPSSTTGQPHGRVFNFSAGPAVLPLEVLEQAQADLLNWRGSGGWHRGRGQARVPGTSRAGAGQRGDHAARATCRFVPIPSLHASCAALHCLHTPCPLRPPGMSVMEMSHRGKEFQSIIDAAEADLRALLAIPDNYHVLFMQVGGDGAAGAKGMHRMYGIVCWLHAMRCWCWGLQAVCSTCFHGQCLSARDISRLWSIPHSPADQRAFARASPLAHPVQGGASTQFSAIPLNLAADGDTVDYIVTGSWSKKAASGARLQGAAGSPLCGAMLRSLACMAGSGRCRVAEWLGHSRACTPGLCCRCVWTGWL